MWLQGVFLRAFRMLLCGFHLVAYWPKWKHKVLRLCSTTLNLCVKKSAIFWTHPIALSNLFLSHSALLILLC